MKCVKNDAYTPSENLDFLSPDQLKPWPNNPRDHSEKQMKILMASIREFGFTAPVLADENFTILAGHARSEAAKRLKIAQIPVRVINDLSQSQKRAYVIADNRITDLSGWDPDKLRAEVEIILQDPGFDVELTGFDTSDIDLMIHGDVQPEEDDPADLKPEDLKDEPPVSRIGDLWLLGEHRLYCGDALEAHSYKALMMDSCAQMAFTDPPYNVSVSGHIRTGDDFDEFPMASGEMSSEEFILFLDTVFKNMAAFSADGSIHYVCMDWRHIAEIESAAAPTFGKTKQLCVWAKNNGGMGSFYRSQHELVFVFKNGNAEHINNFGLGDKGRYRTNVWFYKGVNSFGADRDEELAMHPTVKPVAMVADAIWDCSKRGGIILDPFCGSGTTIMAAEKTGRLCYAMELDPVYVDVAIARWQRLHDVPVTHGETGLSFENMKAQRHKALLLEHQGGHDE